MRQQMFQQFGGAGAQDMDLNSLLPDDMFTENAERRVKLGLVLSEIDQQVGTEGRRATKYVRQSKRWHRPIRSRKRSLIGITPTRSSLLP